MFKKLPFIVVTLFATAFPLEAAEQILELDLDTTAVTFTLGSTLHTVDGVLHLKEGRIVFDLDSGAASGRVVFDATLTETGNKKRDKKMHAKVLESGDFPDIVFTPETIEGTLNETGDSNLTLGGTVSIHGSDHPVTLKATVERKGGTISATSALTIPFVEWGMEDPSAFIFRADKQVEVSLRVQGILGE